MATAFISEHTAEFILVPKMARILAERFTKVIPLYFLSTKEGSRVSRECDQSQPIRVVNVFARRPKVAAPNQPLIEAKFNSELFEKARLAAEAGIPTLAGVPLVSSLTNFSLDVQCAWFSLSGILDFDVYYWLLLDGTVEDKSPQSAAVYGPLQESKIVEDILKRSREMTWRDAIERLRLIRRISPYGREYRVFFGGGYHPFSLLLY